MEPDANAEKRLVWLRDAVLEMWEIVVVQRSSRSSQVDLFPVQPVTACPPSDLFDSRHVKRAERLTIIFGGCREYNSFDFSFIKML